MRVVLLLRGAFRWLNEPPHGFQELKKHFSQTNWYRPVADLYWDNKYSDSGFDSDSDSGLKSHRP